MTFQEKYDSYKAMIEEHLAHFFPGEGLNEVMRYSLLAGGKRIRPVLTLAFCEAAGGEVKAALDFACAVEMLHTYSLIHDDLPCMDNDDLRRGKPTCHRVYGETAAVLAGDALQAAAFHTVLMCRDLRLNTAPQMAALILSQAAGPEGMCLGQYWDTLGKEGPDSLDKLIEIDDKKTGDLLRAACMMGVVAAMGWREDVPDACMTAAMNYAADLGLAFQIKDDLLDVTSTAQVLGKPIGSDAQQGKVTYVTLAGAEECQKAVERYTAQAKQALADAPWVGGTQFLLELAEHLISREK